MHFVSRTCRGVVLVGAVVFAAAGASADQPKMEEALRHLRAAEQALADASAGKDGHRRDALVNVREAIHDVRLAMHRGREQSGGREHHSDELSPRALRACARAADEEWGLRSGASVPHDVRERKEGVYEVEVSARHRHGLCIVTEDGEVRRIEGD